MLFMIREITWRKSTVLQIADVVRLVHSRCALVEMKFRWDVDKLKDELTKEKTRGDNLHRRLVIAEAEIRKLRQQRKG